MAERKALDLKASGLMMFVCIVLGLQQVMLKIAAPDISPLMQMALRSGLAAVLVSPLLFMQPFPTLFAKQHLKAGIAVATLFALEFFFVAEALRFTSASHTIVLLYTAPIFTALGLQWKFPEECLSRLQWGGIGLAFVGILVTFIHPQQSMNSDFQQILFGDFYALLAGISWAATTILIRFTVLSHTPAIQTLFYQLSGGFIVLLAMAIWTNQTAIHFTLLAITGLAFQTLLVAFTCLLLWFWLLRNYLASQLGVFSFLTPLFGVVFGVWLLGEKIELNFVIGSALVLLGIIVVSFQGRITK
ncbi:DMT family transporter [Acinetobacter tjernbergiae]|uniref:EamA domain-containing protein n=1 Tax=Acinetobacter tjernbergiae DSM 14971 = CIP 107465 TaxID=1120928 RepID=V2V117_9GAMM|nr:DMT family transporter [Acinetobacter tjernbergiae]ESK54610.1 hypothetical protein F990_02592 [Acinetobacter tjernbergiae DSM 14971 = CIP 107465]